MEDRIAVIESQFLQGVPIAKIDFDDIYKDLDWNLQEKLLMATVLHKLNVSWPLKREYQISFLKHAIEQLESNEAPEIHDIFYEQLAKKLNEVETEFSYKHFSLKSQKGDKIERFSIKESNSFIRDGTTGLKVWPAAIKLGNFVAQNPHIFDGQSVLELGSGASGLVGLAVLTFSRPKKICLSDCHDLVIEKLIDNVSLNLKGLEFEEKCRSLLVCHRIKLVRDVDFAILKLPWESIEENKQELKNLIKPDILIAADIVYDEDIFDALFECLEKVFAISSPGLSFYLSQTIRNPATYQKFLQRLLSNGYDFDYQETNVVDHESDIKIIKMSKTQASTCEENLDGKCLHDFPL